MIAFLRKAGLYLVGILASLGAILGFASYLIGVGERRAEQRREKAFTKKKEENVDKAKEVDKRHEKMDDINDAINDFTS